MEADEKRVVYLLCELLVFALFRGSVLLNLVPKTSRDTLRLGLSDLGHFGGMICSGCIECRSGVKDRNNFYVEGLRFFYTAFRIGKTESGEADWTGSQCSKLP